MQYLNISGYKFVSINDPVAMEKQLRSLCNELGIRGTILLSKEGINVALAGTEQAIQNFKNQLAADEHFTELCFKDSWSEEIPFRRLRVRIKNEIVMMRVPGMNPNEKTGKHLSAKEFKQWLETRDDFWVLDTRNDYEVKIGSFDKAIDLNVHNFRELPEKLKNLPEDMKKKPMVMFCTGGIRCEKASAFCLENGFEEVYQLEDGIIKYFEEYGGEHWRGECFVFDNRVAVKPDLTETEHKYCLSCLEILTEQDINSDKFAYNRYCPHCYADKHSN